MTQQTNNTSPAIVEQPGTDVEIVDETEVLSRTGQLDGMMQVWRNRLGIYGVPIHLTMLEMQPDPETREAIANAYFGVEPRKFSTFANRDNKVIGMCVYEHGPFKGKTDGLMHEGYYKVLVLIEEEPGKLALMGTGSIGVMNHALNILHDNPWFLFTDENGEPSPRTYYFSLGEDGRSQYIYNRAHASTERLLQRKATKKSG